MSRTIRKHWKLGVVAVSCLAIGAGASAIANAGAGTIANAGASTTHSAAAKAANSARAARLGPRRLIRRAVHANLVVATRTGYANVSFERGVVESISGRRLTLREGTKSSTYRVLTLTIPATARVREDRRPATLSDVKPGQRAWVIQAPNATLVVARTP